MLNDISTRAVAVVPFVAPSEIYPVKRPDLALSREVVALIGSYITGLLRTGIILKNDLD